MIPTLPPLDITTLAVMIIGNPIVSLIFCAFAGLLVGKQEHDNAKLFLALNPDADAVKKAESMSRINTSLWGWLEDASWGFFGGLLTYGTILAGIITIPLPLLFVSGFVGRKLVLKAMEKF